MIASNSEAICFTARQGKGAGSGKWNDVKLNDSWKVLHSRVKLYWSNVELHSTSLSFVPSPMSSCIRHRFPLYQVQCRVAFDIAFLCTRSNVELHSTSFSFVLGPMSSCIRHRFLLNQVQCRAQFDKLIHYFLC